MLEYNNGIWLIEMILKLDQEGGRKALLLLDCCIPRSNYYVEITDYVVGIAYHD